MKATHMKPVDGMRGDARLYRLDPPLADYDGDVHEFVIVSAVVADSGPETYIFPADESGKITDWLEMPGSFKGALDHVAALANAGYEVTL